MDGRSCNSSKVASLPPPRPRSPPEYPDLYGKRREAARVQMLEREIRFLEEELKSVNSLQPSSRACKEVADFVVGNSDPLIPTTQKKRKSGGVWRWLSSGLSCFSFSWICCCCCSLCPPLHFKLPSCGSCSCSGSCGSCKSSSCGGSCGSCKCGSCSSCCNCNTCGSCKCGSCSSCCNCNTCGSCKCGSCSSCCNCNTCGSCTSCFHCSVPKPRCCCCCSCLNSNCCKEVKDCLQSCCCCCSLWIPSCPTSNCCRFRCSWPKFLKVKANCEGICCWPKFPKVKLDCFSCKGTTRSSCACY